MSARRFLLGEAPGCPGRRIGRDGKTIPTPEIPVARDEPLSRLELRHESGCLLAGHHADLQKPAGELLRCFHVLAESLGARGQSRVGSVHIGSAPAHGRRRIDGRLEIVAESRPECCLVTFVHRDLVDHGRPETFGIDMQKLGERLGFGIQPVCPALRLDQRDACRVKALTGSGMGGLGSKGGSFRLGQCGLCGFRSLGKAGQIDAFGSFELLALRLYRSAPHP